MGRSVSKWKSNRTKRERIEEGGFKIRRVSLLQHACAFFFSPIQLSFGLKLFSSIEHMDLSLSFSLYLSPFSGTKYILPLLRIIFCLLWSKFSSKQVFSRTFSRNELMQNFESNMEFRMVCCSTIQLLLDNRMGWLCSELFFCFAFINQQATLHWED